MKALDMNIPAKRLLLGGVAILGVAALAGCGGGGNSTSATIPPGGIVITDGDGNALVASFSTGAASVAEDGKSATVTVTLSRAPTEDITLNYTIGGTATGADFAAPAGSVTIPKGETTATITVPITDDTVREAAETLVLTLTAGNGYELGTGNTFRLTITDNDGVTVTRVPGTPVITYTGHTLYENQTTASITVTLSSATTKAIALGYTLAGTAGTHTIPVNTPKGSYTFEIDIDPQTDGATLALVFEDTDDYNLGTGGASHTLTATMRPDPNALPELSVPSMGTVQEGGTVTVTVSLTSVPASAITLMYTVDGGAPQLVTIPARHSGAFTFDVPTTGKSDGDSVIIVLTGGTGYTVASDGNTHTVSVTMERIVILNDLLGAMDQDALNTAVRGVSKPVITGQSSICGNVSECATIVNKLEEQAKKYAPLSREQLHAETVGSETFGDVFGRSDSGDWAIEVDTYRFLLSDAIETLEGAAPPHAPDATAISTAVRASANLSSFVGGRNAIASGLDPSDNWGVWIKEGDATALRYWHREGGQPVSGNAFFTQYANDGGGNATYQGNLNGYAHYTDSQSATQAGTFGATVALDADFGAGNTSAATITGTVSGFTGTALDAGWGDVTLNADYTAEGATTAADASGQWSADLVYDTDTSDTQPDSIAGRVGLTFTGDTNPGGAAGVFEADKQ
ncbi:MAG: hypothetical protein OXD36_17990 [Rhodobacter sp.]|nr:hypothetical protein [Rhodobacter sp.]